MTQKKGSKVYVWGRMVKRVVQGAQMLYKRETALQ